MKGLKKILFLSTLALMAVCGTSCNSSDSDEDLDAYIKVDAAAFKARIESAGGFDAVQILDYRSAADFAKGHLPNAINIEGTNQNAKDENGEFRTAVKNQFSTSKTIFVYGSKATNNTLGFYLSGIISKMGWGIAKTIHMTNGYESWVEAGYSIEK